MNTVQSMEMIENFQTHDDTFRKQNICSVSSVEQILHNDTLLLFLAKKKGSV